MKPKLYFAAPWFTACGLETMQQIIQDVKAIGNKSAYDVYFPYENQLGPHADIFHRNVDMIKEADVVIALLDEKDCGTSWELGMAYALNKEIYIVVTSEENMKRKTNLMLAYCADAIFKLKHFVNFITNTSVPILNTTWGNIE